MKKTLSLAFCFALIITFSFFTKPSFAGLLDFLTDKQSSFNSMQLCQSIRKNQIDRARKLLKSHPDLANRLKVVTGCNPPLHEAVSLGRIEFVKELAKYVKDINAKWENKTALDIAKESGNTKISKFLREHGAKD